jgi:hypothetical protein
VKRREAVPRVGSATELARAAVGAWVAAVAARPRAALLALAVLAGLAVAGAARLSVDTDSSRMLDPDLPFQARAHALNEAFPAIKNSLAVVVRGPRADPVEAAAGRLAAALAGEPAIETAFAPSAHPFFLRNGLLYLDTETLDDRLARLSKASNLIATLREDRSLGGFLAAVDAAGRLAEGADLGPGVLEALHAEAAAVFEAAVAGEARAFAWLGTFEPGDGGEVLRVVSVTPRLDFERLNPAKGALAAIDRAVAGLDPAVAQAVEIGVTGEPALRAEELESVTSRLGLSLGLSVLIVAVVLWLALGTAGRVGLALGALFLTLLLTTGFAGAAVGALNLVSVAFIVLMVGLGIDFAIHFLSHLDEDAREADGRAALGMTARALGPALILTAFSTSAAFLAFGLTDFVGMAQLGLVGGAGVLLAFAVAVTLIPAVVALRPGLARGRPRGRLPHVGTGGRPAAWIALAAGLAAAVVASQARFDADPMSLRDPDARSVQVYQWLVAAEGRDPLRLSLLAPDAGAARAAAERLAELAPVRRAVWLGDLVPEDQDAKLALIDLAWPSLRNAVSGPPVALTEEDARTPAALARRLAGQGGAAGRLAGALRAYEAVRTPTLDAELEARLFRHWPLLMERLEAQLAVDGVAVADLPEPLVARYRAGDGRHRVEILPEADLADPAARAAFVEAVAEAAPGAAGPPAQIEGASGTVAAAMAEATLIALAAAAALAVAALPSFFVLASILVPVVLAGAVTMAASVLLGIPFNYANIIVLPLLIGIGVDSGIHLALRTLREGQVFSTATPRAVAFSALTTIGAFATLALSEHRGTASMGLMLTIALLAAILMTFALTPWLARLAGRRARR